MSKTPEETQEELAATLLQPTPESLNTTTATVRLPRHNGLWASVSLNELLDRQNDDLYPARLRLLLFLRIRTRRGEKSITVTNTMAWEIGLDRAQKHVCLKYLEAQGHITVQRDGLKNPIASLRKRPRKDVVGATTVT
jgi:hypothetical protein